MVKKAKATKKNQITKIDIFRWITVLPTTILAIIFFERGFIDSFFSLFHFVDEEVLSSIVGITNGLLLPALIVSCGFLVSPKFKFKSSLVLAIFFIGLQTFHYFDSEYVREGSKPFIPFFTLGYLLSLYCAYKLDKKK